MQLDIFEHSREVMLRNDVIQALERRDPCSARTALDRMANECPTDGVLPNLRVLAQAVENRDLRTFGRHENVCAARQALEGVIRPAAQRVFGDAGASEWLAVLWQDLAQRAELLPFRAEHADEHAAALWLQARQWKKVITAVETIASWRRIPAPLAWMAEARLRTHGLPAAWALLAELGWLSPRRLVELVERSPDPLLVQLVRRFEGEFEGDGNADDMAWFVVWVLTERPQFVEQLASAQASQNTEPERAMRVLVELLGLERQGRHRDIVDRRKALRDLHPCLYGAYMKTR